MKWIKTQSGSLVRVGAVSSFTPTDKNRLMILFGENKEEAFCYKHREQAAKVYEKLISFIRYSDTDDDIFEIPQDSDDDWMQCINEFDQMGLTTKEYNAMRGYARDVFEFYLEYHKGRKPRGIGVEAWEKVKQKIDCYVEKMRGDAECRDD